MKLSLRAMILCLLFQVFASAQTTPSQDVEKQDEAVRNKLSTLWTVVSLNMIGADVLTSYIPGSQDEVIKFAGGKGNVKNFMLAGAAIYEIPISMIFLSKYLPYNANRWTNVSAAALSTLFILGGGSFHPHYIFIASAETLTLGYIAWTSIGWLNPDGNWNKKNDIGIQVDPNQKQYGLKYSYHF